MLPMCADMGVGCVQYSPQGKGRLTRPGHADRSVGGRCGGEILRPGCRPAGRGRGPARCRVAGHPDVEGRAGLAAGQARRIGADRRSHQAAPPRRRRGPGRGRDHRGRDPTARGAVHTAGSRLVVKRAAPAARKSRQEFPSRLGLGLHPARERLRMTVSTARELEQATPELEERFTHSGWYKRNLSRS